MGLLNARLADSSLVALLNGLVSGISFLVPELDGKALEQSVREAEKDIMALQAIQEGCKTGWWIETKEEKQARKEMFSTCSKNIDKLEKKRVRAKFLLGWKELGLGRHVQTILRASTAFFVSALMPGLSTMGISLVSATTFQPIRWWHRVAYAFYASQRDQNDATGALLATIECALWLVTAEHTGMLNRVFGHIFVASG